MQTPQEMPSLTIGAYQLKPLPTGHFGLDGGAMFGTVPKVLWERNHPADTLNRISLEARGLLLTDTQNNLNIVIDTGNGGDFEAKYGPKLGKKFAALYDIQGTGPTILQALKKYQITAEDITHCILTHLHFDHAGGGTMERGGRLVPTFPKARYFVQESNLETARTPNPREKASYFPANFEPLLEAEVLERLDSQVEVLPGVSMVVSHGHTQGQQCVKVSDGENTLLYCGDVIPTRSHVRLAWVMGYDLHPLTLIEEKRKILSLAADEGWYLFFEHDPVCNLARVERDRADFKVSQLWSLAS